MASALTVENLYSLGDEEARKAVVDTFMAQLKNSPSVRAVFFSNAPVPAVNPVNAGFVDNLAVALVCSAISRSALFEFGNAIHQSKADGYWQAQLGTDSAVAEGRALYDWAFPDHCRGADHSFREYLSNNPKSWAAELVTHVTSPAYVNGEIGKLVAGQPNWLSLLNLVFYKFFRLDGSVVPMVLDTWKKAYPDKGIVESWKSCNFIPSNHFQGDQFKDSVNQAINVETIKGPERFFNQVKVSWTYGHEVVQFLSGKSAQLGLATGSLPKNVKVRVGARVFWTEDR